DNRRALALVLEIRPDTIDVYVLAHFAHSLGRLAKITRATKPVPFDAIVSDPQWHQPTRRGRRRI
ncbi:MAG: hypothetical protein ACR2OU_17710, partial [Thermomicrobiales bacterium]